MISFIHHSRNGKGIGRKPSVVAKLDGKGTSTKGQIDGIFYSLVIVVMTAHICKTSRSLYQRG